MDRSAPADLQELLSQSGWLRKLALHLVESPDQADDLVQDTFQRALEHPTRPSGLGWLARVMRNLASNRRRDEGARAWHERAASRSENWAPGEIEERVKLQRTLADAVLGLEEPYRSAITLHYFEGIAPREIARRQRITYDAARQRIARGVGMLRARLDREHAGDRSAWCAMLVGAIERSAPRPVPWGSVLLEGLAMSTGAKVLGGAVVVTVAFFLFWGTIRSKPQAQTAGPLGDGEAPALAQRPETNSPAPLLDARSPLAASTIDATRTTAVDRDRDLHGEVVDPAGKPVAGAKVEVFRNETSEYVFLDLERNQERRKIGELETDVDGRFALPLDTGRPFLMEVSATGFARELFGNRYAGEHVLVRLHAAASVEGLVKRAEDGAPISAAHIRAWPTSGEKPSARFLLETETDEGGRFHFDGLPPTEFYLEVTPPIGAPPERRRIDLVEGERQEVEFVVEAGPVLRGRVLDGATGSPIANAEVGAGWTFRRPVRTNSNGEYVYAGFPLDGTFDVHARATGFGRMERTVREPDRAELPEGVDFELLPARRARGRILDADGAPVPGAYVAAVSYPKQDWRATMSGVDGNFELEDLRSDTRHTLLVRKEGFGTVVYDFPASEETSSSVDLSVITIPPMSLLKGCVVGDSGEGVPNLLVTLRGCNSDRYSEPGEVAARLRVMPSFEGPNIYVGQRRARTDDLGRFSFADLAAGSYDVSTRRRGGNPMINQTVEVARAAVVEGIRLVLPGDGSGSIEGRVIDYLGRPVPKAYVHADPGEPSTGDYTIAETRADGHFVILGLLPGIYQVRAGPTSWSYDRGAEAEFAPCEIRGIEPGRRDLEIVLRRGAWLQGRVLSADARPVAKVGVTGKIVGSEARTYAITDEAGRFRMLVAEDDLVDLEIHPSWIDTLALNRSSAQLPELDLSSTRASRVAPNQEEVILRLPKRP